jgi:hypothetical protein
MKIFVLPALLLPLLGLIVSCADDEATEGDAVLAMGGECEEAAPPPEITNSCETAADCPPGGACHDFSCVFVPFGGFGVVGFCVPNVQPEGTGCSACGEMLSCDDAGACVGPPP